MKLSLTFVSLAAVAAAAPLKAAVWSKVAGGDGKPHYRIGLGGAGPSRTYKTPTDIRSVDEPEVELIQIMPFPMPHPGPTTPDAVDSEFVSPPFVPEDMILPAVAPASLGHNKDKPVVASTKPCHGMSAKSVEVSNWLRKAMGMPVIAIEPVHVRPGVKVLHVEFKPVLAHAPTVHPTAPAMEPHTHHKHYSTSKEHKHKHNKQHGHTGTKERSFADRLTLALMSLGRWEGRIVAFVLGCGIGVLLRLLWVMGVLSYRSLRNRRSEDDDDEEHETLLTEQEAYLLPPPEYTNEKVALAAAEEQQQRSS